MRQVLSSLDLAGLMSYQLAISTWEVSLSERRRARRFAVGWPVKVEGNDTAGQNFEETGKLQNLSSAGALISIAGSLQIGSTLEVLIKIPLKKDSWMKYSAEVVRVEASRPESAVAIRFFTFRPKFVSE
jgi:hypothetical protein